MRHIPILLNEFLSFYAEKKVIHFIDATVGAAGHAKALLHHHPEIELFIGIDKDPEALEIAKENLKEYASKVELLHGDLCDLKEQFKKESFDGIFFDLGVSSMQLDQAEKGFSFSKEGPLDMRMDPHQTLDAATVVNTYPEKKLEEIFRELGEERKARQVAKALVEARKKKKLKTTGEFCEVLKPILTWGGRQKKIHPMTLVFQGLRIYVNNELGYLQEALPLAISLLKSEGRMGVISFHSLEDRIVKNLFRDQAHEDTIQLLTKKPLVPNEVEMKKNPRSRSAKMRWIEKR